MIGQITENQKEYIKILSSYEYSKKDDEVDIAKYLKAKNKKEVSELSKAEASKLITIVLKRPTEYVFNCGRKAILNKREVNCFHVLGDLEGCLHACPNPQVAGNVNGCPDCKGQVDSDDEAGEDDRE